MSPIKDPPATPVRADDPRGAGVFEFARADYDRESGTARLVYRFDGGPRLVEKITFPGAPWPGDPLQQAAFGRALDLLHGVAGVSYYKAGLSPAMRFGAECGIGRLGVISFLQNLYVEGLGEFGYVNGLDVAARVHFPGEPAEVGNRVSSRSLELPDRALVAMGGGKDSLVGLDLLRAADIEVGPACVGTSPLIAETVHAADLPLLQIRRTLAPQLDMMNRAGAWNGHVPVTAINSAILLCAAILYGYRYVVFSNERSADEATVVAPDGREINHQYSKSFVFEAALRSVIARRIAPGLEYFSVLRPFSELGVVERFAALTDFHAVFSSCNRNFHLDGPRVAGRWCRDCPKCRFLALSLALFLPPARVAFIQGGDLLDDPLQLDGFRALCRLGQDKPFECVGESGESRAALRALRNRPEWRDHVVVKLMGHELRKAEAPGLDESLQPSARHFIPPAIAAQLGLPEAANGTA